MIRLLRPTAATAKEIAANSAARRTRARIIARARLRVRAKQTGQNWPCSLVREKAILQYSCYCAHALVTRARAFVLGQKPVAGETNARHSYNPTAAAPRLFWKMGRYRPRPEVAAATLRVSRAARPLRCLTVWKSKAQASMGTMGSVVEVKCQLQLTFHS